MSRKVVPLTLDVLGALEAPTRSCVFWELDAVRRGRVAQTPDAELAGASEKEAWVSHVLREWGSCGRMVLVDGEPVGLVEYAPEPLVPGAAGFPTAPVSPDAVVLAGLYVRPEHRGGGLARMLVQAAAADLIKRGGIRALETFAGAGVQARRSTTSCGHGACVVPQEFWGRVGFKTHRSHPAFPRMRMELRSALTWRDEVEAALERLVGVVRPTSRPVPSSRTQRRSTPPPTPFTE